MSLFWPKVAECRRVMLAGCAVMTETKITHILGGRALDSIKPLQLTVQGQFTEGTFTIAAAPIAAATISRQTTQQVMLPLTLVSLSALPGFYVGQQLTNLQYTTLVGLYPNNKDAGSQKEKDKQLEELKQTAQMVSFVMDVAAELTKITQFAENNFNKLPAMQEAKNPAHYCFEFEEGKDITASALKETRQ